MLRSRRVVPVLLRHCTRCCSTVSPWGDTTLEALCRRDQSGEALRVVATLALDVIQRAGRSEPTPPPGGSEPTPSRWHGQPAAAAAPAPADGAVAAASAAGSIWGPERVRRCASAIHSGLIGREREATLLLLAGLAGEHALILGPAGVGKSALAQRLASTLCGSDSDDTPRADGSSGGKYFERQLSRFSTPEELLGPLSITALKVDQHSRCTEGYLLDPALRVGKSPSRFPTVLTVFYCKYSWVYTDCPLKLMDVARR